MTYFPTRRTLVLAWAALMLATTATAYLGKAGVPGALPAAFLGGLAFITWVKAGLILRVYLNLRTAPAWADGLMILVGLVLAMILVFFALPAAH